MSDTTARPARPDHAGGPILARPERAGASPPGQAGRRADLDALRGFAMILGIALHASLAYFPYPWPVQDSRQERLLGILYAAIHGFRMPLFFLLSGFFTMLVLRRRGLRAVLEQRALRILLPLAIAGVTLLPLDRAVISWAVGRSAAALAARNPLAGSILAGDQAAVRRHLADAGDLSAEDPAAGPSPLALAAMRGETNMIAALIDAGADADGRSRRGGSPLDAAALMGQADAAAMLMASCPDAAAPAAAAFRTPAEIASLAGSFLGLPRRDADQITRGRRAIRALIADQTSTKPHLPAGDALAVSYQEALAAPELSLTLAGFRWQIFSSGIFDHLWFLWYLCWLVAAFALAVVACPPLRGRHRWWLMPASCLPAALMWSPFGPDTALGLLPVPHLFLFYACFFWFGAATYAAEGAETALGARWQAVLPLSLGLLFPLGLATIGDRPLAMVIQPAYAWGMSLGLIGLFRRWCSREQAAVRWLSDASYWMYLIHLPLVIVAQVVVRDEPWPALAKFLAVLATTVALALLSYRWCVRFTPIGWLLNGPRTPWRPCHETAAGAGFGRAPGRRGSASSPPPGEPPRAGF